MSVLKQLTSGLQQFLQAPDHQKGLKLQTRTKMTEKITSRAHNPLNLTERLGRAELSALYLTRPTKGLFSSTLEWRVRFCICNCAVLDHLITTPLQ